MPERSAMCSPAAAARAWCEAKVWPVGCPCPRCGSPQTTEARSAKRPDWWAACRSYFNVTTGSGMAGSPFPLRKWVWALSRHMNSLKGVSSPTRHPDSGVHRSRRGSCARASASHAPGAPPNRPSLARPRLTRRLAAVSASTWPRRSGPGRRGQGGRRGCQEPGVHPGYGPVLARARTPRPLPDLLLRRESRARPSPGERIGQGQDAAPRPSARLDPAETGGPGPLPQVQPEAPAPLQRRV